MRRLLTVLLAANLSLVWAQAPQSTVPGRGNAIATYGAAFTALAPASSATDIAVLSGNATNVVVVTYAELQCTQTTAGIATVRFLIRTAADSGGTSSSITGYTYDQNNSNTTAVSTVTTYTANPTVNDGTNRLVSSQLIGMLGTSTPSPNDLAIWFPHKGQAVVLRGTAQQFAMNLNGATISGASCNGYFEWMETPTW
jgi:hypothetical protein